MEQCRIGFLASTRLHQFVFCILCAAVMCVYVVARIAEWLMGVAICYCLSEGKMGAKVVALVLGSSASSRGPQH